MIEALIFSVCIVVATLITLSRVTPWRVILKYAAGVDIVFTVGLFFVFGGTLGGAMAATIAGLLMALLLSAARLLQRIPALRVKVKPLNKPKKQVTIQPVTITLDWNKVLPKRAEGWK